MTEHGLCLLFAGAAAGASAALTGTSLRCRASDALLSRLLSAVDIQSSTAEDQQQGEDNHQISHEDSSLLTTVAQNECGDNPHKGKHSNQTRHKTRANRTHREQITQLVGQEAHREAGTHL